MVDAKAEYRNSVVDASSDDDDDDDDDEGTESDGSPRSLTNDSYGASIVARAADQALNMLVDVSAQAEAKLLSSTQIPYLDLEKQVHDLRERVIHEQGMRSNRAVARAGLAAVTLKENIKLLERLCTFEDSARMQIPITVQNLQSAQRIEQREVWSNISPDEIAVHADQLADNAQAQFLALTDRIQRYSTRESEAKFRMLVHRCLRIAYFLSSFRMAHAQRTEIYDRIFTEVMRRWRKPGQIESRIQEDISRLIQMEKHMALSPRVMDQAEEYMEQEMMKILQPDVLFVQAEPSFSRLISQFEELSNREQQKLQAVKDSEAKLTNAYSNAMVKFASLSESDRANIIMNPVFKQQGEDGGEFHVSDRDRRAALKSSIGSLHPVQPMSLRVKEQQQPSGIVLPLFSKSPSPELQYNAALSAFKPKVEGATIVFPTAATAFVPARAEIAQQSPDPVCSRTGGIPVPIVPVPAISSTTPLSVVSAAAQAAAQALATTFQTMPSPLKPIPKGFTSVRCPTSTDQVTKIICRCIFGDGEQFEFYHMSYMSKNQKELEFPYSPTQQLSVVIPDHLFVVDSICECMSTIPETVVSLKSKKKSFFRALTNLGFAHKMQAKRMKKFQKQAWCATLPGTMQWIKRVRSFSTNTLHIDDLELERLIQFIETRVVPILENWQSIEQVTILPLMAEVRT